jgi:hypothetical protein
MLATSRVKRGRHRFRLERRLIAVTSVVWLKRDLRVADHRPLTAAAARGRVVVLFVYEPELIAEQTTDPSHYTFIDECLIELEAALGARGGALTYRYGPMPDVLATLSDELGGFDALYAHEETGSAVSYARDKRVRAWCAARGIACYEIPQFGVIRPLRTRDGWARRWDARMTEPLVAAPSRIETPALAHGARRTLRDIGLPERHKPEAKRGGESRALAELESFLATRGVNYRSPAGAAARASHRTSHSVRSRCGPCIERPSRARRTCANGGLQANRSTRAGRARFPHFEAGCIGIATSCKSSRISRRSSSSMRRAPSTACGKTISTKHASPRGVRAARAIRWSTHACAPCTPGAGSISACAPC